jgi:hypothetical protein
MYLMELIGARIREQGQTFQVVVVKRYVVENLSEARRAIEYFSRKYFPGVPIVLMAQDLRGRAKYVGRRDIVNFLASISSRRIPWKRYFFS